MAFGYDADDDLDDPLETWRPQLREVREKVQSGEYILEANYRKFPGRFWEAQKDPDGYLEVIVKAAGNNPVFKCNLTQNLRTRYNNGRPTGTETDYTVSFQVKMPDGEMRGLNDFKDYIGWEFGWVWKLGVSKLNGSGPPAPGPRNNFKPGT